jgi:antitoxin VapB
MTPTSIPEAGALGGWKSRLGCGPGADNQTCDWTLHSHPTFIARRKTPLRPRQPQQICKHAITPFWYDYTMALNIKDPETEQLAADVASLAGESKTAAIRQALRERRQRLLLARDGRGRGDRMVNVLEASLWPKLPAGVRSAPVTRAQREAILGYGPEGV